MRLHGRTKTLKEFSLQRNTLLAWTNPAYAKRQIKRTTEYKVNKYRTNKQYARQISATVTEWRKSKKLKDDNYRQLCNQKTHQCELKRCNIDPIYAQNLKLRREFNKRKRQSKAIKLNQYYTAEDRNYTLNLFEHKCAACGSKHNLNIDHWRPLSKGHVLSRKNAVVLCNHCNVTKSDRLPEVFFPENIYKQVESKLFAA